MIHPTHLGGPTLIGACQLVDEAFAALLCIVGWRGAPYAATACRIHSPVRGLLRLTAQLITRRSSDELCASRHWRTRETSLSLRIINNIALDILNDPDPFARVLASYSKVG